MVRSHALSLCVERNSLLYQAQLKMGNNLQAFGVMSKIDKNVLGFIL